MSAFGSCEGPKWTFENGFYCITGIEHCVTGEPLKIPGAPDVVTGVKLGDDPTIYEPDEDGVITLPQSEDLFGSGVISEDGTTLTVQFPNMDAPVDICLDPVKGAVLLDDEGNVISEVPVVDGILQLPDQSICWGTNDDGLVVVGIKHCQTGEFLVLDYAVSVSGPGVTDDGAGNYTVGQSNFDYDPETGVITHTSADGTPTTAETKHSTTVPSADGTGKIITTDDGNESFSCDRQFKGVRLNDEGEYEAFDQNGDAYDIPINITRAVVSPGGQTVVITDGITGQACTLPKIEQDQVLAGWQAVPDGDPNDGVTTWHWEWLINDIDGNLVNTIAGPTITVPEFVNKAGALLTGPITPLLASDFAEGTYAVGDKLMVLAADGSCKLIDQACCFAQRYCSDVGPDIYRIVNTNGAAAYFTDANGIALPAGAEAGYVICPESTPCCAWSQVVASDGTVTNPNDPRGEQFPALDAQQRPVPAGCKVIVTTDLEGENPVACPIELGLIRLPSVDCDTLIDCTPDAPKVAWLDYVIGDLNGGEWEWVSGGPWVRTRKANCMQEVLIGMNAPNWNGFTTPDGTVMAEVDIDFPNPTCDVMHYNIETSQHAEIYTNLAGTQAQVLGFYLEFDGSVHQHVLKGGFGNIFMVDDLSESGIAAPLMQFDVPPKSTVTKVWRIIAKNPGQLEVGSVNQVFLGLRGIGQAECN